MSYASLQAPIEALWERRDTVSSATGGDDRAVVMAALEAMDSGQLRVAEADAGGTWQVRQWAKQAVLLSFRLVDSAPMDTAAGAYDKVPLKFADWGPNRFKDAGFRAVPGAVVRKSAYIAPGVVLMPSFVNVGAYVDRNTMVDTWATVGSCAQIGKNVHISGGVGIGGVLEPLQANPVIIEDDCFIGARSEVAEGVVVERGAVLSMGVFLGASTKIINRATGEVHIGRVPGLFRGGPRHAARPPAAGRHARPEPLLRRHREDGRCPDPLQDLDQRAAARLMANTTPTDPVPLAQALIRCPSVTPADAGALGCWRRRWPRSASPATGCASARPRTCSPGAAPRARISATPAIPTWSRRASRAGPTAPSRASSATARSTAAAPAT